MTYEVIDGIDLGRIASPISRLFLIDVRVDSSLYIGKGRKPSPNNMYDHPIDPHDVPLEDLFPNLKPEKREAMRDFLDGYCEIAWQIWNRLEEERASHPVEIKRVADIIKRNPKNNAA